MYVLYSRLKGKYEAEMEDMTKELETVREKWTKSREEAAKRDEEQIMVKALLKQKEVELNQAMEVLYTNEWETTPHPILVCGPHSADFLRCAGALVRVRVRAQLV